jgi:hypothetical protein
MPPAPSTAGLHINDRDPYTVGTNHQVRGRPGSRVTADPYSMEANDRMTPRPGSRVTAGIA